MSEHTYPQSEHIEDQIDYLSGPLPELLRRQRETLVRLTEQKCEIRERDTRRDEAICYLEWRMSRLPAQNASVITPSDILRWLGDITVYAETGKKSAWIEDQQREMDRP